MNPYEKRIMKLTEIFLHVFNSQVIYSTADGDYPDDTFTGDETDKRVIFQPEGDDIYIGDFEDDKKIFYDLESSSYPVENYPAIYWSYIEDLSVKYHSQAMELLS